MINSHEKNAIAKVLESALLERLGDEVDLIFHYGSMIGGTTHRWSDFDFSYVPQHTSTRAHFTLMVNDILFDLYPLHWLTLERMGEWDDWRSTILLNLNITYARNDEVTKRMDDIRARHISHLEPNARRTMTEKALRRYQDTGYEYYQLIRQGRSGNLDACFHHANRVVQVVLHTLIILNQSTEDTRKLEQMLHLKLLPDQFDGMIGRITSASSVNELIRAIDELLDSTHDLLLNRQASDLKVDPSYPTQLDSGYPELKSDLQHVILACERRDALAAQTKLLSFLHELHLHLARAADGVEYSLFNSPAEYDQALIGKGFPALLSLACNGRFDELAAACLEFDQRLRSFLTTLSVQLNCFTSREEVIEWLQATSDPLLKEKKEPGNEMGIDA